jgi:viroplasmin and RNaseH domain-containing protein
VYAGYTPGVYDTWDECSKQVIGYSNNSYKGSTTREKAEESYFNYLSKEKKMSNHGVGKKTGCGSLKDFIILIQFIVIVIMWLCYVR